MSPIKVVLFRCDRCSKDNTLVAYHRSFGWYCKDCLTDIRDRLTETINRIDICASDINKQLGIDTDIELKTNNQ